MPIKCKKGKVRYRRIKFKGKHKHYLQLAICPRERKARGKIVETKLKSYKKLRKMI